MKHTTQSPNGTSFHGNTFKASLKHLVKVFGNPHWVGNSDDKVQAEWEFETEEGDVFTIYDWKEYRGYSEEEILEWHIGAHSQRAATTAEQEILSALAHDVPLELEESE